jgi:hypothetical protein
MPRLRASPFQWHSDASRGYLLRNHLSFSRLPLAPPFLSKPQSGIAHHSETSLPALAREKTRSLQSGRSSQSSLPSRTDVSIHASHGHTSTAHSLGTHLLIWLASFAKVFRSLAMHLMAICTTLPISRLSQSPAAYVHQSACVSCTVSSAQSRRLRQSRTHGMSRCSARVGAPLSDFAQHIAHKSISASHRRA